MKTHHSLLFLFLVLSISTFVRAQEAPESAETKLRSMLRDTMLQLRDAQGQVATLQATQAQSDKDNADLKAKIDTLNTQIASITKQSADDKDASDKALADLKSKNDEQTTQIGKLNDAIAEWEKDDKQFRDLSQAKEVARAQLAGQVILLQRIVDDRETKNLALFTLGNEILTRYDKYGLGEAITAKEPFTGVTRVKLQELVQDYQDKLLDQRVIPGTIPPAPPAAAAPQKATATTAPVKKQSSAPQTASSVTP